jgi:D-sedoheptulose 7-phosphate isomerase
MGQMEHPNKSTIKASLLSSSQTLTRMAENTGEIEKILEAVLNAYQRGNKLVLFGNGGSAADAQHIATEMVCSYVDRKRRSLPALALTTDTSALTAIGNDFSFDDVFSRQVESMVNEGDVVVAISTSGNSPNVIKGAQAAKKRKAVVVGFTGESGGNLKAECHLCLCVPSTETARIQEAHIAVGHLICAAVEKAMSH